MAKIEYKCAVVACGKKATVVTENRDEGFGLVFKTLTCGHTITETIVALPPLSEGTKLVCKKHLIEVDSEDYSSFSEHEKCEWDEKPALAEIPQDRMIVYSRMMDFQRTGVEFLEKANYNAALCDEQGLGKTIQILQAIAHHKDALTPTLYVVKAGLRLNWVNEMVNNHWLCNPNDPSDFPFPLMDGRSALLPGFKHYIVPFSLLDKFKVQLASFGFKCLVVDESQAFSNMNANRTEALLEIAERIPHRMCISGTPILNRASEYYPTLHMIKPDHWNNYSGFIKNWIEQREVYNHQTGKTSKKLAGLIDWKREEFFRRTSSYMLRRRKRDVLKDLPKFRRNFLVVDISETGIRNSYNDVAKALDLYMHSQEYFGASGFEKSATILGYLMKMRHLCGMAKSVLCIEQASDFLESTELDQKLIIGCHHDDVMQALKDGLAAYNPVMLPSGLDNIERTRRIDQFKAPQRRLCIAKILAQGEGLNLQFCSNMIVLERMWNPGKEEQFEARIDRYGQQNPTVADYIVAKNTVDEDFSAIVEDKRQYCGGAIDKDFDFEMNSELLVMLAERASKRKL